MAATAAILNLIWKKYEKYEQHLNIINLIKFHIAKVKNVASQYMALLKNTNFDFLQSLTENNSKTVSLREKLLLTIRKLMTWTIYV